MYLCVVIEENTPILFHEKQRFSKWFLLLVFLPAILSAAVVFRFAETGKDPEAFIGLGIALLAGALMVLVTLETSLTAIGVSVRFIPFLRKTSVFLFEEIASLEVVTYRPIREYGGWGLRRGKNGLAYSVSGKQGVLITFKEPKKLFWGKHKTLLIGTRKPDAWRSALQNISQ
jgi:hypothetical protein